MGEQAYAEWVEALARKSKLSTALKGVAGSAFFIFLAGGTLLFLTPTSDQWGFWFSLGILTYGFAIAVHHTLYFWRLFKKANQSPTIGSASGEPETLAG